MVILLGGLVVVRTGSFKYLGLGDVRPNEVDVTYGEKLEADREATGLFNYSTKF